MNFASDNTAGADPAVLDALKAVNDGPAAPYGADPVTAHVEARLREIFEAPRARVILVSTGTAANALALAALCPPWGRIYCHCLAHIEEDECNAPVFFTDGASLKHVDGRHASVDPAALEAAIAEAGHRVVHHAQPAVVSITEATERGAIYRADDVAALGEIARRHGLGLHMDGTRFAAAVAATGAAPADLTHRAGVDVLCLGATKTGALGAEAVILFEPERHAGKDWELALRRKRAGHLVSKMRFVAAQMDAWLDGGRWLDLAAHANAMAARLRRGLERAGVAVVTPPGANLLFARLGTEQDAALRAAGAVYYAGAPEADGTVEARLVCHHATAAAEVDRFLAVLSPQVAATV
ncbi:MAG: threonine aldolase family protein [Paracoccaceae bacterium]